MNSSSSEVIIETKPHPPTIVASSSVPLSAEQSASISVQVTDKNGAPVNNARVEMYYGEDDFVAMMDTDSNGECSFDDGFKIGKCTFVVRMESPDAPGVAEKISVNITAGKNLVKLDLTNANTEGEFFAYPKRVDIYVSDKNGNPVSDAYVFFAVKGLMVPQTSSFIQRCTNKDGRVTFANTGAGTFSISINKDMLNVRETVEIPEGQDVTVLKYTLE